MASPWVKEAYPPPEEDLDKGTGLEDLDKGTGLGSTTTTATGGARTTVCSRGTAGLTDLGLTGDNGSRAVSRTGTPAEERILLERELRASRPGTALSEECILLERELRPSRPDTALSEKNILEQELRHSQPDTADSQDRILECELRCSRPGTALSQGQISEQLLQLSRSGSRAPSQEVGVQDLVASCLSRDMVEQAAKSTRLSGVGHPESPSRSESREGVASVLSLQAEPRIPELRLGQDMAESFSMMLSEELELAGRPLSSTRPASSRHSCGSSRSLGEQSGGCGASPRRPPPPPRWPPSPAQSPAPPSSSRLSPGVPEATPPVCPPPPLPFPPAPPAEPAPRLRLEPLGEETSANECCEGEDEPEPHSRSQASTSEWAGTESVASMFSEPGGAGSLRSLATIGEEEALVCILDRVMMDVGRDLPEAQQRKPVRPPAQGGGGLGHRRPPGADARQQGPPGGQESPAEPWRPASACSVASLRHSPSMDERLFCNELSHEVWQEICERLDGSVLGKPAAQCQDCCQPLTPGAGAAA